MYRLTKHHRVTLSILLAIFLLPHVPSASAAPTEDSIHVYLYGPSGPSPAIRDAAMVFGGERNVEIEVTSGPIDTWMEEAKKNADLIYSSAEFMMSDFMRREALGIERNSITPLYIRPSVVLVRPGNPKQINDFPDLLRPGLKVMVVNGSGQVGLWEDMAGKTGDIRTLRALRRNISVFAPTSDDAVETWRKEPEIDAWITWNIWFAPLHDQADMVHVSDDYRIYRQCSIAVTSRGSKKPVAYEFIHFLASSRGAEIFESWGWMIPPKDSNHLTVRQDICAVYRVNNDEWADGIGKGLLRLRELLEDYEAIGVPASEIHICAVVHGEAAYWLLNDDAYGAFTKKKGGNPNKDIIRELCTLGVSFELCGRTMKAHGWTLNDLLPEVKIVPGALPRIIDLQLQGYAYLRF
jgi:accessory colonization factor AcfC